MTNAKEILKKKGQKNFTIDINQSVIDALRLMAEKNIGAVLVTENDEFKGIFTERDYSRKIALEGKSSSETKVGEVMSTHHPKIAPTAIMEECLLLMGEHNVRYLPVFENEKLMGIISISDVVDNIIELQKETIYHLKNYINM